MTEKGIDYTIHSASSLEELKRLVTHSIANGWEPQGGVSVIRCTTGSEVVYQCSQAMVKWSCDHEWESHEYNDHLVVRCTKCGYTCP